MAFLPIFFIGMLMGIAIRWAYDEKKQQTPSETKFYLQEAQLTILREDIKKVTEENEKLRKKLNEVKQEAEKYSFKEED